MKKKVIVIGIDGGDFKVINPLIKRGILPNIKKIMDNSSSGMLQSSVLPSSEQAWSSFSSGCNNGKHGIYSYMQRPNKGYNFKLVDGSFFKGKRFWDILSNHGKKSIIINVTATYPPQPINGVLVTGRLTPNNNVEYTYPSNIKREISKIAPNYITRIPRPKHSKDNVKKMMDYVDCVGRKIEERGKVAKYLMNNHEWDLFMLTFDYTDDIQHLFWSEFFDSNSNYKDVIPKIYKKIDNEIGRILSDTENDSIVILMSDHGFAELKRRINFNVFLKKHGYLIQNKEKINNLFHKILKIGHKLIPNKFEDIIKKYFFSSIFAMTYSNVNWQRTKAFTVGSGGICINLKDREHRGIVDKDEYEKIRDEIIEKLKTLKDPKTGKPIIKEVFKREEIYKGNYVKDSPDIVNLLIDGYKADLFRTKGQIFSDEGIATGNHSFYGFFAITGKGIKKVKHDKIYNIMDLAPTILHLLDVPIPQEIDGKVLKESFDE